MHRLAIPLLVALAACGADEDTFVWGEASAELAQDWCEMRERCLELGELDTCVRHNVHHLCELEETCDVPVPEAAEVMVLCAEELAEIDGPSHPSCPLVYYGFVPSACEELLAYTPAGD